MSNIITLYSVHGCPQCRAVEMLLKKKNLEFAVCQDVDRMKEKGITHTPALEVNEGMILQGKAIFDWVNKHE